VFEVLLSVEAVFQHVYHITNATPVGVIPPALPYQHALKFAGQVNTTFKNPALASKAPYGILQPPLLFQDLYSFEQRNPHKRDNNVPAANIRGGGGGNGGGVLRRGHGPNVLIHT
jgi:hypothetical protein